MEYPEIDKYASLKSPIHKFDPRAKILTFSSLIFLFVFVDDILLATINLIFAFTLLLISRLPLGFVFDRMKPVFLFVLPILVIMSLTVEGSELVRICGVAVSYEGVRYGTLITARAIAAVTLALTMLGTMRFDTTIKALYMLKVPGTLVQMMMFTYRYIFVLLYEFSRMRRAMSCKGFVLKANRYALSMLGNLLGMLIVKSYERALRVHKSMISKGYTGSPGTITQFNMAVKDYVLVVSIIGTAILLRMYSVILSVVS